jgi:hypothetical protein
MFWFSVLTLMRGIRENNPDSAPLFDESLMLVKANSEEEAKEKAEKYCLKRYKTEHKKIDGETVSWKFVKIIEVTDRCEKTLYDGIQIYSRLF